MSAENIERKKRRRKEKKEKSSDFDYSKMTLKELQQVGVIKEEKSFEKRAGERIELAIKYSPILIKLFNLFNIITAVSFALAFYFYLILPPPMLLLSSPNGDVECAALPIDINTGKTLARSSKQEQELCDALERYNKGDE